MLAHLAALALLSSEDLALSVLSAETQAGASLTTLVTVEVANRSAQRLRAMNVLCALTHDGEIVATGLGQLWAISPAAQATEQILIHHQDEASNVTCRMDAVVWGD